jgi:hypothetical protein
MTTTTKPETTYVIRPGLRAGEWIVNYAREDGGFGHNGEHVGCPTREDAIAAQRARMAVYGWAGRIRFKGERECH